MPVKMIRFLGLSFRISGVISSCLILIALVLVQASVTAVQFSQLTPNSIELLIQKGNTQYSQSQYQQALDTYQYILNSLSATDDDIRGEVLRRLGLTYIKLSQYQEAITAYQTAIALYQQKRDWHILGILFNSLGLAYQKIGNYPDAQNSYEKALENHQRSNNKWGIVRTLNNMGSIAFEQSSYETALQHYQQALIILQQIQTDPKVTDEITRATASILSNLGLLNSHLGQSQSALNLYENALMNYSLLEHSETMEQVYYQGIARTYHNIGFEHEVLQENQNALIAYQKAIQFRRIINDLHGQALTLNNMGMVYSRLGQIDKAIDRLQMALEIVRNIEDQASEGRILDSLGYVYQTSGQYELAFDYYQQALIQQRQIGNRTSEHITLSNIGSLLVAQTKPELAISFYKQAVNVIESIRAELQSLPEEQQKSYIKTVADTYRTLADLLLDQGRILEAQAVLELLKLQEIRDYTRNVRAVVSNATLQYTPTEEQVIAKFGTLIAFGQKVSECDRSNCPQASQFNRQREQLVAEYNQYIDRIITTIRQRRATDDAAFDPRQLGQNARKIVEAQPNTMLIYPFILPDKLWLLWVAPGGIANRIEVPVTQRELGEMAMEFRNALDDYENSDLAELQAVSYKLYQWLIQPLENELQKNEIKNLVFSLDRVARYLPMAALFDGEHYLIENYQISTILTAELTDLDTPRPYRKAELPVLALGLSESKAGFNALSHVTTELDNIVRTNPADAHGIFPGQTYLNQQFTFRNLADNINTHRILHLATHGKFQPGLPSHAYLVLGDGSHLTIDKINTLQNLNQIHLAVLSACETALGGPDAEGLEIAGLGYYFLAGNGAKAVLASLWRVNDSSTSELMQHFYRNLGNETQPMTKAEALRQAQLSFLHSQNTGNSADTRDLSHPYYWAPFILIGNNL